MISHPRRHYIDLHVRNARSLPCPHLLPGKAEDKKDKKDKKESEKHKDEGSGVGGNSVCQ